jgi:radical SAM superfamily enzyme YgiQ (UPF0313 family)
MPIIPDSPDIVLVQSPGWGVLTPPLALAMLTGYCREEGYTAYPIDFNIECFLKRGDDFSDTWELSQSLWFWENDECVRRFIKRFDWEIDCLVDRIIDSGTGLVGFTIYSSSLKVSLEIARRIKAAQTGIQIVFGGPHVSRFMAGQEVAKEACVDLVVDGEGEYALVDIIRWFHQHGSLKEYVPGPKRLVNLDELPFPDFSYFDFHRYAVPNRLPVMSSRGCLNRCIFCNERPFWGTYRVRKAESVFEEVRSQFERYPFLQIVDFQDSLVNGSIREIERFAELIIERGMQLNWAGQAVIRKEMTVELLKKLKSSGCVCLAYGMETASTALMQRIGKVLSKGADPDKIAQAHKEAGLDAVFNIMFGLPGETEEDAFDTQEFLRRNGGICVNPSPAFCGIAPGTLAYEDPGKYSIDLSKGSVYWESIDEIQGFNNYLIRLKRFENFCRLVMELGTPTTYPHTKLLDRNRMLGNYYEGIGDNIKSVLYFGLWLQDHPGDREVMEKIKRLTDE